MRHSQRLIDSICTFFSLWCLEFQPQSTTFFCQKVSGIQILIEDSVQKQEGLEVTEVMVSNAFYSTDKVISTIHKRLYNNLGVWFVFSMHSHIMCNSILYPVIRYFSRKKIRLILAWTLQSYCQSSPCHLPPPSLTHTHAVTHQQSFPHMNHDPLHML